MSAQTTADREQVLEWIGKVQQALGTAHEPLEIVSQLHPAAQAQLRKLESLSQEMSALLRAVESGQ
jgi:hypothetical protein